MIFILLIKFIILGDSLSCNPIGWQSSLKNTINLSSVGNSTSYMLRMLKTKENTIDSGIKVIIFGGINDVYGGVSPKKH